MVTVGAAERPWPDGCLGAVSLTFDDGRASHLSTVVPLMDELGLHGTFYLNPRARGHGQGSDDWRGALEPWRPVQAAGHEIGNHSLSHVCSQAHQDLPHPERPCLEGWTLGDVEADVLEAERRLDAVLPVPASQSRSFCYPCYHEHVGAGTTRQSYVPVIARHFVAARGRGEFGDNRPATCDLHYLWSWNTEAYDGPGLIGRVERAVSGAHGRWVILAFHDIGVGSGLSNRIPDFRELLEFLVRHRERLWTAPVAEVAHAISRWREADPSARYLPVRPS